MIKRYEIKGMKCQGCVNTVTEKLSKVIGVEKVDVDLEKGEVAVTGRPMRLLLKAALRGSKFQLGDELK